MRLSSFLIAWLLCCTAVAEPVRIIIENADGTQRVFVPEATPDPEPPPPPPPPPRKRNIGINLAHHRYYSTERPFTDLAKQMSPWQWSTSTSWGGGARGTTDVNGFPVTIPTGVFVGSVLDMHRGNANGPYTFAPTAGVTADGQTKVGEITKSNASQRVLWRVRAPITSFTFTEPGAPSETFWPPFLERTKKFGVIRFMDWSLTNEDRPISWSTRTTPSWYTQADKEVAWEYQFSLAIQCDAAPWICVHHRADDVYVRELAKLAKSRYTGKQPIFLEHSNEVWNGAFPQYRYCADRSPKTRSPLEYHIARTAAIARIFREEGNNIVSVLGAQAVGSDHFRWVVGQVPLPADINAVAIAPYFGYSIQNKLDVNAILAECAQSIEANKTHLVKWRMECQPRGLRLLAYEGGQHLAPNGTDLDNPTVYNNYIAANRHERMYQLYLDYLKSWDEATGSEVHCLFNSTYAPQKWGSWGLWEFEGQPLSEAHKARAVLDYMEGR